MGRLWKFSRKSQAVKKSPFSEAPPKQDLNFSALESGAIRPTNQKSNSKESDKALRDLWQEALDNLSDEKKSALKLRFNKNGQVEPCVSDAIQGVVTSIEASFDKYRNGGWKVRDRDGNVIFNVRESGKKILRFALRSKAIIDSGVKFDPTGYSSSAWTVISLGLQFVQNDQDRMSAVFDASALLAGILHRYANIEANYRDQDVPDVVQLEDHLRSSYEAILSYVAMVEEQRCQRAWGRVWYSLYSLSEQPLQQLRDGILSADNAAEQWRQLIEHEYRLKEAEIINKKVDEAFEKLDRILDGLDQNLMAINRQNGLLEMILIHLESKDSTMQMATFLHQRVAQELDQPTVAKAADNMDESKQMRAEDHNSSSNNEENLDQLLQEVFVELREFGQDTKRHQQMIENLPEMRAHKTKTLNLQDADKIVGWIESASSDLLWINGHGVIGRYDFNSLFVVPLLLCGEGTFESVLILRHFCGDNPSFKTNNYRTLVQALIFQILKQRPSVFQGRIQAITRDRADDILKLWALFVECIRKVSADCTFIIIDSIDYLQDTDATDGVSEGRLVLQNLGALVKDDTMLIKILLTSKLTSKLSSSTEDQTALVVSSRPRETAPRRRLSLAIIQDELPLVPQKLIEIQERRCQSLSFSQLYMIYPENSVIYTFDNNLLQAFIVDRLSGMEEKSTGTYSALQIRAWSVDHNGRYFTKRYHDIWISQFPGEKAITSLKYIPSGYLPDESEHRAKLIARGRRYWKLGNGIHYQQLNGSKDSIRIIIDQCARPLESPSAKELEDEFQFVLQHNLKPRMLMVCPPTIASYDLSYGKWKTINIDEVHDVRFESKLFHDLIMPKRVKNIMRELILSQTENHDRHSGQIDGQASSSLTVLLHGGPGTGKTFTATAMAEETQRPLLVGNIEMGGSIADFEQRLSQSFQLAQRWGALLLLEDVDSFLAQREHNNSSDIIAIFDKAIQAIDKYSGVLFMTTRRVGVLDEAVHSRIDYMVRYKPLSLNSMRRILRTILQQGSLSVEVVDMLLDIDESFLNGLNGRDIQAAVHGARQLASRQGVSLHLKHFQQILKTKIDFSRYIFDVQGDNQAVQAQRRMFRSDLDKDGEQAETASETE